MYFDKNLAESQYQILFSSNPLTQSFDNLMDKEAYLFFESETDFLNHNQQYVEPFDELPYSECLEEEIPESNYMPNWL